MAIEMERGTLIGHELVHSKFASKASQTISVFQDFIVYMTERGIY